MTPAAEAPAHSQPWTVDELCRHYSITRQHLHNLWSRDRGPKTIRLGRRVLITEAERVKWEQACASEAA